MFALQTIHKTLHRTVSNEGKTQDAILKFSQSPLFLYIAQIITHHIKHNLLHFNNISKMILSNIH